jgi:hypothetical protein
VGGSLGLAALSTIALNAADDKGAELCRAVAARGGDCGVPALQAVSFTHGATIGFLCCAGMLLLGAVVALLFNRIKHQALGGR